ncbi:reverse transcriptase domain-containing protein [Tanacetum coccineum]
MKDQPLSADASHTALSPSYIANFNLEEDEEDPEEDPAVYPANEGNNSDDESSDDDNDDDDVEKGLRRLRRGGQPPSYREPFAETMTTVDQGMSVEEIERVIAERVANAIEAIAIYETKPKWARNCKEGRPHDQDFRNMLLARNQRTRALLCSVESLRHFKKSTTINNQEAKHRQGITCGSGDKKPYGGLDPCRAQRLQFTTYDGPCAPKCYKCNKYGHIARDCRGTGNANAVNNQRVTVASQKVICYECGNQGALQRDCPEH